MSLLDMIETSAGPGALQMIGTRVGLSPDQLRSVIASVAPDLVPKLAQHADNGGLDNDPAAPAPPAPGTVEATDHGKGILGAVLGSKDASRSVASNASAQSGVSVEQIEAVLPQLASMAATAYLAHRSSAQRGGGGGGLGGLFSSVEQGFGLSTRPAPLTRTRHARSGQGRAWGDQSLCHVVRRVEGRASGKLARSWR